MPPVPPAATSTVLPPWARRRRSRRSRKPWSCSSACCMYTAKQAILTKDHVGMDTDIYVFYIDIRATGKGYEEFIKRAQTEFGVKYVRGRVSKLYESDGKVVVRGAD